MGYVLKHKSDRVAFRFGRASGLRSTDEVVEQLSETLRKERAQHRFDLAEKERELALVSGDAKAALRIAFFMCYANLKFSRHRHGPWPSGQGQ